MEDKKPLVIPFLNASFCADEFDRYVDRFSVQDGSIDFSQGAYRITAHLKNGYVDFARMTFKHKFQIGGLDFGFRFVLHIDTRGFDRDLPRDKNEELKVLYNEILGTFLKDIKYWGELPPVARGII